MRMRCDPMLSDCGAWKVGSTVGTVGLASGSAFGGVGSGAFGRPLAGVASARVKSSRVWVCSGRQDGRRGRVKDDLNDTDGVFAVGRRSGAEEEKQRAI